MRSLCEALGIPVQTANQDGPNFWRLRETRMFLEWLEARKAGTVTAGEVSDWLDGRDDGNCWQPLKDACAEFAEESGAGEALTKDLIEWLAEWGRDLRRKQTGLLLLTAHRAKGLEFDHVAVLDGSWERRGSGEDRDAARRLYYVAMTRARLGLTLMCRDLPRHPVLSGISDSAFLIRRAGSEAPDTSGCRSHYQTLDLSRIDISWAGRLGEGNASLKAIEDAARRRRGPPDARRRPLVPDRRSRRRGRAPRQELEPAAGRHFPLRPRHGDHGPPTRGWRGRV